MKENFGSNESINFNYHCNKLVSYRSFFFTVLSYLPDSLQYKQFLVPFIDSSSRLEEKYIKNFAEWTGKKLNWSLFFHKDLMIGALLKIRHSNTCFLVNFLKFLRPPSFIEQHWWLLLHRKKLIYHFFLQTSFSSLKKINNNLCIFSLPCFAVHNCKLSQMFYTACLLYGAIYRAL